MGRLAGVFCFFLLKRAAEAETNTPLMSHLSSHPVEHEDGTEKLSVYYDELMVLCER